MVEKLDGPAKAAKPLSMSQATEVLTAGNLRPPLSLRGVDQKDLECSGQFGQIRSLQQEWQSRSADELDRCGNMPSA